MLGAIIGDIVGSAYEFNPTNDYDFELFKEGCGITDDTICTVAIADALLKDKDYGESLHEWCRRNPNPKGGYGSRFKQWVLSKDPKPYYSLGNGSAMRVSPIAWEYHNLAEAMCEARKSAICTHNHPEGIKGAEAVVMAIHYGIQLRLHSARIDREAILEAFEPILAYTNYDIDICKAEVINCFDETCPGTVPVALWIITESTGFEDAIRKAVSLGADADTLGAIVGSIAEAIWGIPDKFISRALNCLTFEMKKVVMRFYNKHLCNGRAALFTKEKDPVVSARQNIIEKKSIDHDQEKAIMLWKLGLGHIGKFLAGEDPMPSKEKRALASNFDIKPMPEDNITEIPMYYEISEKKMRILKQGHIPESQEDHWIMCCESNYIRYYRSLTGMCAFVAHYYKSEDKYIIDFLMTNHELSEFSVNGDEPAKALFLFLLSSETDGFNHGLWQAYLDAWEKQCQINIEKINQREQYKKTQEEHQHNPLTPDDLRMDKLEKRKKLTKGASLFMGTNIACTKHIKNQHIFYMFEENDFLTMRLEPDNIHEKNAVALYFGDDKVGYIPEKDKNQLVPFLKNGWENLFLVYVSDWNGCGEKRWISIKILVRPKKPILPFAFDEDTFTAMNEIEHNQLYYSTGGNTGTLTGRTTPARIDRLEKNEVFVFGSNQFGHHHGGAAAAAMKKFGAVWGVGDGLQGQSYAISTMEGLIETTKNVNRFIRFAAEHQELKFFVTPIGCGIAGYNPLQIAPLFAKALALPNVYLPRIFWEYYWQIYRVEQEFFIPDEQWKKWDK